MIVISSVSLIQSILRFEILKKYVLQIKNFCSIDTHFVFFNWSASKYGLPTL